MSLVVAKLQFAQHFSCDAMCARVSNILDPICRRDFAQTEFGDTAAIDLFVLADYEGNQLSFINILDLASTYGVVAMIPSKHPKIVWGHFFKYWFTPFGVPWRLIYDQGGEFEREFGQELEDLGCEPMPTAAITPPQQNAVCERHGGIWKTHARRQVDEFSVKFVPEQLHRVTWLTAATAWQTKSRNTLDRATTRGSESSCLLREGFGEVENTSLQWLPTHLQVSDPLTKMMERDILVSFFNSRAFQPVAKKIYANRTATDNV